MDSLEIWQGGRSGGETSCPRIASSQLPVLTGSGRVKNAKVGFFGVYLIFWALKTHQGVNIDFPYFNAS